MRVHCARPSPRSAALARLIGDIGVGPCLLNVIAWLRSSVQRLTSSSSIKWHGRSLSPRLPIPYSAHLKSSPSLYVRFFPSRLFFGSFGEFSGRGQLLTLLLHSLHSDRPTDSLIDFSGFPCHRCASLLHASWVLKELLNSAAAGNVL